MGMSVDERWNKVLAELPAIGKNSVNQQQGFKFRSIDDVLDRLKPLFAKHGVHPVPVRQTADRTDRPTRSGGILNVCYITVDWEIRSVDGDFMTAQTLGEGTDSGDKSTSKAQTMALKYLLWPSLSIATNEDPDSETQPESVARASKPRAAKPEPEFEEVNGEQIPLSPRMETTRSGPPSDLASPKQVGYLKSLLDNQGFSQEDIVTMVAQHCPPWPDSLRNLSKKQASVMIELVKP